MILVSCIKQILVIKTELEDFFEAGERVCKFTV